MYCYEIKTAAGSIHSAVCEHISLFCKSCPGTYLYLGCNKSSDLDSKAIIIIAGGFLINLDAVNKVTYSNAPG